MDLWDLSWLYSCRLCLWQAGVLRSAACTSASCCLQAHTGIARLELSSGSQMPLAPLMPGFQHLQGVSITAPGAALAALLPSLQQLRQLTALSLTQAHGQWNVEPPREWQALVPALLPRLHSFHMQISYHSTFEPFALEALQQAAQLTNLSISQPSDQLAAPVADKLFKVLSKMRHLVALNLHVVLPGITPSTVGTITQLKALTYLQLRSTSLPPSIAQLTVLKRLQRLELADRAHRSAERPIPAWPAPRAFHSLQSFNMCAHGNCFRVSLCRFK